MRIIVFILISVLPQLSFGQIDTLTSFFNDLPSEFHDKVYLLDDCTKSEEYEQAKIIWDGHVYLFESNQRHVGASLVKFDYEVNLGFYENSLDTFRLSDNRCIVFANPFPFIYYGAPSRIEIPNLEPIETMYLTEDSTYYAIQGRVSEFVFVGDIYRRSIYGNRDCVMVDSNSCLCTEVKFKEQLMNSYLFDFPAQTLSKFTIDLTSGEMKGEEFNW